MAVERNDVVEVLDLAAEDAQPGDTIYKCVPCINAHTGTLDGLWRAMVLVNGKRENLPSWFLARTTIYENGEYVPATDWLDKNAYTVERWVASAKYEFGG